MDRLRLGIIGWGPRGRGVSLGVVRAAAGHLFDLVAAADPYEGRRQDAQEQLGPEARVYPSHQELLQDPGVDAVLVFTGAQAFAEVSCAAMRAGKPVCADVPMAFTRQDVWDLVVTSEQSGVPFCMAEQVRFANFVVRWQEHVERGDIGEVLFVQGEYIHPAISFYFNHTVTGDSNYATIQEAATSPHYAPTWRNTFVDPIKYIPHELSPLLKIIGDRVATVSCLTTDVRSQGDAVKMLD